MTELSLIALIFSAALLYLVMVGVVMKPVVSIYGYLLGWILFPNGGSTYVNIGGLPLHYFIEPILALGILLALLRTRGVLPARHNASGVRNFVLLIVVVFIFQYVGQAMSYLNGWNHFLPMDQLVSLTDNVDTRLSTVYAMEAVSIVSMLIFIIGILRLVQSREQVERLLSFMFLLSCELLFELLIFKYLIFGTQIALFAFHPSGSFNSLILNDYLGVSMLCTCGMAAGVYFSVTRNKKRYAFFALLFILPIIHTWQRGTILGAFLMIFYLGYSFLPGSLGLRRILAIGGLGLAVLTIFTFDVNVGALARKAYSGTTLVNRADRLDSLFARFGLQLRTVEVIAQIAPLGVGAGMLRFYLSSRDIPSILSTNDLLIVDTIETYDRALSGDKVTTSHNLYLESIAEYGPLAILVLLILAVVLVTRWRRFLQYKDFVGRHWRRSLPDKNRIALQIVSWGAIFYFAFVYMLYVRPNMYVLYWCFIRAVMLPIEEVQTSDQVVVRNAAWGAV